MNFKFNHFAVFFFAGVVLLCETLLFHATKYVLGYILAMMVISCAVTGIGLGAFLASRVRGREADLFGWCCGGTTACLYLAAYTLLRHPHLATLLPAMASVFFFPSLFIACAFARGSAPRIYLFDMLGAGTAVLLVVLAYRSMATEEIFLILATIIPLAGAIAALAASSYRKWSRISSCLWLMVLSGIGGTLLYYQVTNNRLNMARLVNPDAPTIPAQSLLRRESRLQIARSYDSLAGRLDVIPDEDRTFVTYDGFFNDNFRSMKPIDYLDHAKPHGVRFPSRDRRVVYGLVPEPEVFVIGPAADGILKTLKAITPPDHIDAVEINPGILRIMQHDFYDVSGEAYKDLHPIAGNALSVLRRTDKKYDLITLINTHCSRWIGVPGPPDYLHTRESYDLYFDHLTEEGYLLFEERPDTRRGELAVKRMILTLYDCLRRRGVQDPSRHFFVWEFMSSRYLKQGLREIQTGSDMYYVGMVVSNVPFVGQRREDLIDWYDMSWEVTWDQRKRPVFTPRKRLLEAAYLKRRWHNERFGPFFEMIEAGDLSRLGADFDASIVTNDRPFPSASTRSLPEIRRLIAVSTGICFVLGGLFSWGAMRGVRRKGHMALLLAYNVAIGFAYFFVEIMLIQAYQGVFLSPSTSLALVLGTLLIGSAVGGLVSGRVALWQATILLAPALFVCLRISDWAVAWGWAPAWATVASVAAIFAVGMNMGVYFPTGLILADRWTLRGRIPHLFAINALSGSLATVLSLYLGIRVGYSWTLVIAFLLYVAVTVVCPRRMNSNHVAEPTSTAAAQAARVRRR